MSVHVSFIKGGITEVRPHKFFNDIYWVQMPNITPYVYRQTYCFNMAKAGMNPKTLQHLKGHSDIGVTMNTYTYLRPANTVGVGPRCVFILLEMHSSGEEIWTMVDLWKTLLPSNYLDKVMIFMWEHFIKRNWFLILVSLKFGKGGENAQEDIQNNADG